MKLTRSQEFILRAYAKHCHPDVLKSPDYAFLCLERFIHAEQDHITDKGAAYAIAYLGISYTKFISIHDWQKRHAPLMWPVQNIFRSKLEQDIYFREKYKVNLKYNTWGMSGNELQADPRTLKKIGAEVCLALLGQAEIEWKKVRGWLCIRTEDHVDRKLLEEMQSKEYLKTHLELELQKLA